MHGLGSLGEGGWALETQGEGVKGQAGCVTVATAFSELQFFLSVKSEPFPFQRPWCQGLDSKNPQVYLSPSMPPSPT